jgi:hypothetical protein
MMDGDYIRITLSKSAINLCERGTYRVKPGVTNRTYRSFVYIALMLMVDGVLEQKIFADSSIPFQLQIFKC